jgi:hypothetical protein
MSSLLLPLVLLAVPALAVAIFFASAGLLPIDERKLDGGNGRRSISFGLISILFLLGGLAEWGISAYLTQLTVAYPLEFWRWFTRVVEFAVAAGVFCGIGAHALRAWWRFPIRRGSF